MKKEIDNNSMWAAFRQELVLQGELQVVAAIDNALNNLGFTIEETSTIIPIPLKQGDKDEEILILKDKIESLHAAINAIKETHRIELEKQGEQKPTIEIKSAEESLGIDSETYNKIVDECIYGEQKPADKVESNKKFTPIESALKDLVCDVDNSYTIEQVRRFLFEYGYKDKILNAAQEEMQKSAWSKEDEVMLKEALRMIESPGSIFKGKILTKKVADWLKSLKDRVQPKQEWKQENTSNLTDFENAMMHIGDSFFGQHAGLTPNDINAIKEQANLLLELVPRQEWSEEDEKEVAVLEAYIRSKDWSDRHIDRALGIVDELVKKIKSLRPQNNVTDEELAQAKK